MIYGLDQRGRWVGKSGGTWYGTVWHANRVVRDFLKKKKEYHGGREVERGEGRGGGKGGGELYSLDELFYMNCCYCCCDWAADFLLSFLLTCFVSPFSLSVYLLVCLFASLPGLPVCQIERKGERKGGEWASE